MNLEVKYAVTFYVGLLKQPIINLWKASSVEITYEKEKAIVLHYGGSDIELLPDNDSNEYRVNNSDLMTYIKKIHPRYQSYPELQLHTLFSSLEKEILMCAKSCPNKIHIKDIKRKEEFPGPLIQKENGWLGLLIDPEERIIVGFCSGELLVDPQGNKFSDNSNLFLRADYRNKGLGLFLTKAIFHELLTRVQYIKLKNRINPKALGIKLFCHAAKEVKAFIHDGQKRIDSTTDLNSIENECLYVVLNSKNSNSF